MNEAHYILEASIALLPYVLPTIIGISIIMFADLIYSFMHKILSKVRQHIKW